MHLLHILAHLYSEHPVGTHKLVTILAIYFALSNEIQTIRFKLNLGQAHIFNPMPKIKTELFQLAGL
jgi:hypothetical protein